MSPVLSCLAVGLFVGAAASDVWCRKIPNPLVLALVALAVLRIGLALASGAGPGAVGADLLVSAAVFAFGALAFQLRLLGGGDVKLLAAGALWAGVPAVGSFLMATVLAGGVLALGFVIAGVASRGFGGFARQPSLPYGVAIAAGGILITAAVV